jgi:6-pyruvoyltetrahydropterin/6-carboxytetrahydropterin synthase
VGYRIGKRYSFEAAHSLSGLPAGHKCARLHGHSYTVEVELGSAGGDVLAAPGFVTDFGDLGPFRDYLAREFDHRSLNDAGLLEGEPTAENLARHFFDWCASHLEASIPGVVTAVRVWETPSAWAEYRGDAW